MKQIFQISHKLNAPQELILVKLLVAMGASSLVATSSLYLKYLGLTDAQIGISTGFVMLINLVFAVSLPLFLRKFHLVKILITTTFGFSACLVLFGSVSKAFMALLFYVLARLLLSLFASAFSILFHDDSPTKTKFKRNQALAGSINNFAWMLMPFFASLVISQYNFTMLYILVAWISVVAGTILLLEKIPEKRKSQDHEKIAIFRNIIYYFSQKRLRDAYIMSAGVDMWWVFTFTFVTLFMKDAGFSTSAIGIYLTLSQLPLFLFEFKTYVIVDRYKFKSPIVNSYSFMSVAMFLAFIFGLNVFILGLFVFTSLFLVFLEPAREMYFYDKLKTTDEARLQPVYATAELIGSLLIRLSVGLLLLKYSSSVAFAFMALILLAIAWHSRTLKN